MKVFTEDFIREIKARYGNKDEVSQPELYHIATNPKCEPIRDKIEGWASAVSSDIVDALLPRLHHPDQFGHALNELITAFYLSRLGYSMTSEPVIQSYTPDFLAVRGDKKIVVEVFTRDLSAEEKGLDSLKDDLVKRLKEIKADFELRVSFTRLKEALTSRSCKEIAKAVEKWLIDEDPDVGSSFSPMGVKLDVYRKGTGRSNVHITSVVHKVDYVDTDGLRDRIHQKAKKYGPMLVDLGLPYVVAVVLEFTTGVNFSSVEDAIIGKKALFVDYVETEHGREIIGTREGRAGGGLFGRGRYPLSAVLTIGEIDGVIKGDSLPNPGAPCPIAKDYFEPV